MGGRHSSKGKGGLKRRHIDEGKAGKEDVGRGSRRERTLRQANMT